MAAFNYTGWAEIRWNDGKETVQYIDWCARTDTLSVWPEDDTAEDREYLGRMSEHPAAHIQFLHGR